MVVVVGGCGDYCHHNIAVYATLPVVRQVDGLQHTHLHPSPQCDVVVGGTAAAVAGRRGRGGCGRGCGGVLGGSVEEGVVGEEASAVLVYLLQQLRVVTEVLLPLAPTLHTQRVVHSTLCPRTRCYCQS